MSIDFRNGSRPAGDFGGRGPDLVQRGRVVDRERARGGPGQRTEIGRAPKRRPRSRARARTYVPAEQATSTTAIGRSGSARIPRNEVETVDRDLALGQLDRLARPRHRVRPPATDLDRAVGGRSLRDDAGQRGKCRLDLRPGRGNPLGRGQFTLEVVGRRRRPEADRGPDTPCGPRGGIRRRVCRGRGRSGSTPAANGSSVPP